MLFLKALGLLIVIPLFGFGVSKWLLFDLNSAIAKENVNLTISQLCTPDMLSEFHSIQPLCDEVQPILWLQDWSIISGVGAILLLLSFVILAVIAGKSRTRIAKIFPPLVFFSLLILSILVLIQGTILTYSAYLTGVEGDQGIRYFVLIAGVGIGALVGALSLIQSSFKLISKKRHSVIGITLNPTSHTVIFSFVQDIAKKLGASPPDNIVVGLEPNFYVTSAGVNVLGDDELLSGETLFLSLPLTRIFTRGEIKAVIGHELGHFRGQDTYYSRKFSPVYSGLTHAMSEMETKGSDGSILDIARFPALVLLSYMLDVFHKNISAISRDREFEADKAATEVTSPRSLATSLLKISLYAHAWHNLEKIIISRLKKRKNTRNMSRLFSSTVKYDVNKELLSELLSDISQEKISHPTDSHPPTVNRIKQLGVKMRSINHSLLLVSAESGIDLVEEHVALEEKLTALQQQYYIALGVQVPDEEDVNYWAILLTAFGAHMVLADGKVEQEEIDNAEATGLALSEKFDRIDFREYIHYPETLPSIESLIGAISEIPSEEKTMIYDYLKEIAASDNEVSPEEAHLLTQVKNRLMTRHEIA